MLAQQIDGSVISETTGHRQPVLAVVACKTYCIAKVLLYESAAQAKLRWYLQVKPFFDDAAHDKNSCHLVNHVTVSQFKQGLGVKMGFTSLSQSDIDLLIEKFLDDEYPPGDMINYVAFAHCLNPPTPDYD